MGFLILAVMAALSLAGCGGDGGSTAVTVQAPPGTTVCNTTIDQETGAAVNIFCDSDGNVVGEGSVDSNNSSTTPTDSNNGNVTTTTNNNP